MSRLMVLGLGNILHQDKGLGVYAVRDLHKQDWPAGVTFADENGLHREDFTLQGYEHLLILEAIQNGRAPGTRFRLTLDDFMATGTSPMDPMLVKALTVSEVMGQSLEVVFMGLEPEMVGLDVRLTPTLLEAYANFLDCVRVEMESRLERMGIACNGPVLEA